VKRVYDARLMDYARFRNRSSVFRGGRGEQGERGLRYGLGRSLELRSKMTPERHARAQEIFQAAIELPTERRAAYIAQACIGDAHLQNHLQELLAADAETDSLDGPFQNRPLPAAKAHFDRDLPPLVGVQLAGRYVLEKEIGRGGFGVVFRAIDKQLHDRKVVVKLLLADTSQWHRRKFRHEVQALSRISHPGIVSVVDAGEGPGGRPFLVMEFVSGTPLRSLMIAGTVEFKKVAAIVRQLGSALQAAHARGVWHRDLKPENILIQTLDNFEQRVKVIDFGIATIRHSEVVTESTATRVAGTFNYMAPEQLKGKPDKASDLYALGVIAYEWITGRVPFQAESSIQLYALQAASACVKPRILQPLMSEKAERVLLKALAFHPNERYASIREFGYELASALDQSVANTPAPHGTRNLGRLVAKMCNRRTQEAEFRDTFLDGLERLSGLPQIYFILGDEGQCHESLIERFIDLVGRSRCAEGQGETATGRVKKIPWQYEGEIRQRASRLVYSLFEHLGPNPSFQPLPPKGGSSAALNELLAASLNAYIVIQHELHAARWDSFSADLVTKYVEFWSELPRATQRPVVLVFVSIIFPRPEVSSWKKFLPGATTARWRKKQIWNALKTLEQRSALPCRVLAELPSITREDVLEWFSLHNIYDAEEKRMRAVDRLFQDGAMRLKSMWEIEAFCAQEVHRFAAEGGFDDRWQRYTGAPGNQALFGRGSSDFEAQSSTTAV
jgi:serine/threonine protein kinase